MSLRNLLLFFVVLPIILFVWVMTSNGEVHNSFLDQPIQTAPKHGMGERFVGMGKNVIVAPAPTEKRLTDRAVEPPMLDIPQGVRLQLDENVAKPQKEE